MSTIAEQRLEQKRAEHRAKHRVWAAVRLNMVLDRVRLPGHQRRALTRLLKSNHYATVSDAANIEGIGPATIDKLMKANPTIRVTLSVTGAVELDRQGCTGGV